MTRIFLKLILALFFSMSFSASAFQNVLYIKLNSSKEKLIIEAELNKSKKRLTLNESISTTKINFDTLLARLNEWEVDKRAIDNIVGNYEYTLFEPLRSFLEASTHVHFILDEGSFSFALDLIMFNGQPLFLQRPVSFSSKPVHINKSYSFNSKGHGLVIKDKTTDPDDASKLLNKILPKSQYFEMEQSSKSDLRQVIDLEVLLLSLHGIATGNGAYMQLNDEEIEAIDLSELNSKLLYLDSCQIGSSFHFASEISNSSNQFIIAPLFDNEAGDSSTLTMNTFFSELSNNNAPVQALFHTRKLLFEKYNKKYGFKDALWKAYHF